MSRGTAWLFVCTVSLCAPLFVVCLNVRKKYVLGLIFVFLKQWKLCVCVCVCSLSVLDMNWMQVYIRCKLLLQFYRIDKEWMEVAPLAMISNVLAKFSLLIEFTRLQEAQRVHDKWVRNWQYALVNRKKREKKMLIRCTRKKYFDYFMMRHDKQATHTAFHYYINDRKRKQFISSNIRSM